jgi:hypothetical protein
VKTINPLPNQYALRHVTVAPKRRFVSGGEISAILDSAGENSPKSRRRTS